MTGTYTYSKILNVAGTIKYKFDFNDGTEQANVPNGTVTVTAQNSKPVLSSATATPNSDVAGSSFSFSVKYTDSDGDSPVTKKVWIDVDGNGSYSDPSEGFTMSRSSGTNSNGTYTYSKILNVAGTIKYKFDFNDGTEQANVLSDSVQVIASNKTVFPKTVILSDTSSSIYATTKNVFSPQNPSGVGQKLNGECTWYVYGRVLELISQGYIPESIKTKMYSAFAYTSGRHAKNWRSLLTPLDNWYSTSTNPIPLDERKAGKIVMWNFGTHGHVAFVEEVNNDKSKYRISEFNRSKNHKYKDDKWLPFEGDDRYGLGVYPQFYDLGEISFANIRLASEIIITPNPLIHGNAIDAQVLIENSGNSLWVGGIYIALHDSFGIYKDDIDFIEDLSIDSMESKQFKFSKESINSIPGNYQIHLKYKTQGNENYYPVAFNGNFTSVVNISIVDNPNSLDELFDSIPKQFEIRQNYPNPFNPTTMVSYTLPTDSKVKVEIFNMLGQSVAVLVNGKKSAGYYESTWNASNLPSGIYFISIRAEGLNSKSNFSQVKKALLLK